MAVRQVQATRPAAGADWSFVVPAQWLPYLYGITAVLTTALPLTTLTDETGNGHTATIAAGTGYILGQTVGPYVGGANNGSLTGLSGPGFTSGQYASTAASLDFGPALVSMDGWFQARQPTSSIGPGGWWALLSGATDTGSHGGGLNTHDPYDWSITTSGSGQVVAANRVSGGVWHHLAVTWDAANWRLYIDGALDSTTGLKPYIGSGASTAWSLAGGGTGSRWKGQCAGFAFYNATLTLAQIAAHAAANGSALAYKTAVLADTPVAYFGLNVGAQGPSRTVTLKLTDGTKTIAQFPASFPATTADSFTWSWQVLGPGAGATTDGRVNSVPIPEMRVDAGYVISSVTLDLAGTDQWGPITLWFDDGTGDVIPGGGDTGGYLNALLVPDYSHRGF